MLRARAAPQLLVGRPPFHDETEYLTFQQILHYGDSFHIDYPADFPSAAKVCRPCHLAANGARFSVWVLTLSHAAAAGID